MEMKVGSCVLETFVVECRSISLIDLQLTLDRHLNQQLTWYLVHTTLTLDWHINWHSTNPWSTAGQHSAQCWPYVLINIQWCVSKNCLTFNWLSMKCWWSINRDADIDVNWDYESRVLIDPRPWIPLLHVILKVSSNYNFICCISYLIRIRRSFNCW